MVGDRTESAAEKAQFETGNFEDFDKEPVGAAGSLEVKPSSRAAYVRPRNRIERQICDIWESVLKIERIGVRDNFFDLGGQSSTVTQITAMACEQFGVNLPTEIMYQAPTIAEWTVMIGRQLLGGLDRNERSQVFESAERISVEPSQSMLVEPQEIRTGESSHEKLEAPVSNPIWLVETIKWLTARANGELEETPLLTTRHFSLVTLRPHGSKPPLFFLHPGRGGVSCYIDFAEHLGIDRPAYGLQSRGIDGKEEPLTRIEDMAAHYIEILQSVWPTGPYLLIGYSFGGYLSFETAQQMRQLGMEVELLAMIDTPYMPAKYWGRPTYETVIIDMLTEDLRISPGLLRGLDFSSGPAEAWRFLAERNLTPRGLDYNWFKGHVEVTKINNEALSLYQSVPYPGKITLFRSSGRRDEANFNETLGWDRMASEVEIHEVPGDHSTVISDLTSDSVLIKRLGECIAKTETEVRGVL